MRCEAAVAVAALLAASACGNGTSSAPEFVADISYDTLVTVGDIHEANPLLVYRQPIGIHLIGPSTVLYADNSGGVLTAVDLLSGSGWQVADGGQSGPGYFGGGLPWFAESGGRIYTAVPSAQRATRSLDGELLSSGQYRPFLFEGADAGSPTFPVGFIQAGILVAYFSERPDLASQDIQTLQQGLRAYAPGGGVLWTFSDVPSRVISLSAQGPSRMADSTLSGGGLIADARHGTVVVGMNGERWLLALDTNGAIRAEADLPYDVFSAFVDADERVWVQLWARNERGTGSYLVLDRNLSPLHRVTERNVQDARGDRVLTIDRNDDDVIRMHLLVRRAGR